MPPPEPTPEQVRLLSRRVAGVGLVTVLALLTSALPLPWQVLGFVLAVVAIVLGTRALRVVWASGLRRALAAPLVVALVLSGMVLVSSSSVIATWPVQQEYQECLRRALTVSARDTCEAEYRAALESRLTPASDESATP